jgi:crotonobetainyl-CoA:carnitine CoA-transferase CaiB-like acyl-CoA transferase
MRLLSRADVLVQNLAPGASARLNLSFADLLKKHPSLIICNISGYGPDGPYRDKKAYDLLIQSEAGLLSVTGTATQPAKVGISIADICAGSYAYSSILAALSERAKDLERRGCNIDISMLESMCRVDGISHVLYLRRPAGPNPCWCVACGDLSVWPV